MTNTATLSTGSDLREQVQYIADCITKGEYDFDPEYSDYDEPNASDYLCDALDIEWTIGSDKRYLGARVLVAFGGPNIWINTRRNVVEGYWWGEEFHAPFTDNLGLDEFLSELYACD